MSQSDDEYSDSQSTLLLDKRSIVKQSCTDLLGILAFALALLFWLSVTYLAFTSDSELSGYNINFSTHLNHLKNKSKYEDRDFCGWFALASVFYLWLYFITVRYFTKFTIVFTILLTMLFWIIAFYYCLTSPVQIIPILLTFMIFIVLLANASIFCTLAEVEIADIAKVIKDSCKAMMRAPSFLIVVVLQMGGIALTALASVDVILFLCKLKISSRIDQNPLVDPSEILQQHSIYLLNSTELAKFGYALIIVYTLFSLWILTVIYNFGQMILYRIFTICHRTAYKSSVPCGISLTCTFHHIRYHMGTLVYGSTVLTIMPMLVSLCSSPKKGTCNTVKRSIPTTLICLPFVLANATTNAFVSCATHGTNFYCSMKHSFKIVLQDPVMFTATRVVSTWIMLFGLVIIPVLTVTVPIILDTYNLFNLHQNFNAKNCYEEIIILSFILVGIFLSGMNAAISSVLFSSLEDLDCSESYTEITKCSKSEVKGFTESGFLE